MSHHFTYEIQTTKDQKKLSRLEAETLHQGRGKLQAVRSGEKAWAVRQGENCLATTPGSEIRSSPFSGAQLSSALRLEAKAFLTSGNDTSMSGSTLPRRRPWRLMLSFLGALSGRREEEVSELRNMSCYMFT